MASLHTLIQQTVKPHILVNLCFGVQWTINTTPFQLSKQNGKNTPHAQHSLGVCDPHAFQSGVITIAILLTPPLCILKRLER